MTVIGVGLDLVEVAGFGRLLAERGSAFAERVFSPAELSTAAALTAARREQHLAARFAAKEAFVKAWSAALPDRAPLLAETDTWLAIAVVPDRFGRPQLVLRDPLAGAVMDSVGPVAAQVSLTHEAAMAAAVVVLSRAAAPEEEP